MNCPYWPWCDTLEDALRIIDILRRLRFDFMPSDKYVWPRLHLLRFWRA